MRTERLLGIMGVLADTRHTTIGALAARFEVSKRTIARDLDVLAQAGVPLVTTPGAHGGVGVLDGFKVRRDLLSTHDAAMLHAALEALRSIDGDKAVTQLIARLVPGAGARGGADAATVDGRAANATADDAPVAIDFSSWFADGIVQEKLSCLLEAVRGRRCVRLVYVSRSGRGARTVEPMQLLFRQTSWYLRAFCRTRAEVRTFKLQRIAQFDVLDETFEPREALPAAPASFDAPLLLPAESETPGTVLVELDYRAADEFALAGALDARFLYRDEGSDRGVVRFRTDDVAWARRTAKNLGDLVQVREP